MYFSWKLHIIWAIFLYVCYVLKVEKTHNLLESMCSQHSPLIFVLGARKNRSPWSLRKAHSIPLPFLSLVDTWHLLWEAHWVELVFLLKMKKVSVRPWKDFLIPPQEKGHCGVLCPGECLSCQRTFFIVLTGRMGWVRDSRKTVATKTGCTILRPENEEEYKELTEN